MPNFTERANNIVHEATVRTPFATILATGLRHSYEEGRNNGISDCLVEVKKYAPEDQKWVQLLIEKLERLVQ